MPFCRTLGPRFEVQHQAAQFQIGLRHEGLENIPVSVLPSSGHWRYYCLAIANLKQLSNWGFMSASAGAGGARLKRFFFCFCVCSIFGLSVDLRLVKFDSVAP